MQRCRRHLDARRLVSPLLGAGVARVHSHPHLFSKAQQAQPDLWVSPAVAVGDVRRRQDALLDSLPLQSVALAFSAGPAPASRNDVTHAFRQDSTFGFLTGIDGGDGSADGLPPMAALFGRSASDSRWSMLFVGGGSPDAYHASSYFGVGEAASRLPPHVVVLPLGALNGQLEHAVSRMLQDTARVPPLVFASLPQAFTAFASSDDQRGVLQGAAPQLPAESILSRGLELADAVRSSFRMLASLGFDLSPSATHRLSVGDAVPRSRMSSVPAHWARIVQSKTLQEVATAGVGDLRQLATQQAQATPTRTSHPAVAAMRRTRVAAVGTGSDDDPRTVRSLHPFVSRLRARKSPNEIVALDRAAAATNAAFEHAFAETAAMACNPRGAFRETRVAGALEYGARASGGSGLAYVPVVACGATGTCLHYTSNSGVCRFDAAPGGALVLVDAGASRAGYPMDCTRTWPVIPNAGGELRFSAAQRSVYEAVLSVQEALIAACGNGVSWDALQALATQRQYVALRELGVLQPCADATNDGDGLAFVDGAAKGTSAAAPVGVNSDPNLVHLFARHGWGHFLGLDVHETVSHTDTFEAGMVHTAEPGLYFPDPALERFRREEALAVREQYANQAIALLSPQSEQRQWMSAEAVAALRVGAGRDLPDAFEGYELGRLPAELHGVCVRIEDTLSIEAGEGEVHVFTAAVPKTVHALEEALNRA